MSEYHDDIVACEIAANECRRVAIEIVNTMAALMKLKDECRATDALETFDEKIAELDEAKTDMLQAQAGFTYRADCLREEHERDTSAERDRKWHEARTR